MKTFKQFISEENGVSNTTIPAGSGLGTSVGGVAGFDPIMIGMMRRKPPVMVGYSSGVKKENKYRSTLTRLRSRKNTK